MAEAPKLGWYSKRQVDERRRDPRNRHPTNIWLSEDGREVTVSMVGPAGTGPVWPDTICVGPVVKWLRDGE